MHFQLLIITHTHTYAPRLTNMKVLMNYIYVRIYIRIQTHSRNLTYINNYLIHNKYVNFQLKRRVLCVQVLLNQFSMSGHSLTSAAAMILSIILIFILLRDTHSMELERCIFSYGQFNSLIALKKKILL